MSAYSHNQQFQGFVWQVDRIVEAALINAAAGVDSSKCHKEEQ